MFFRRGIYLALFTACLLAGCRDYVRTPLDLYNHAEELQRAGDRRGALLLYLRAAELGSYRAQFALASYYRSGPRRDTAVARMWLQRAIASARKAAVEGDIEAPNLLAQLYFAGDGVTQDRREARRLWRIAIARGNRDAQYALAFSHFMERDYERARPLLQSAVEHGSHEAAMMLSRMYRNGWGVEQDVVRSVELLRQAADAKMHGAEQELTALLYGIDRAARDGHPEARQHLEALQVAEVF